jgi:hypothetical protein
MGGGALGDNQGVEANQTARIVRIPITGSAGPRPNTAANGTSVANDKIIA